MSSQLPSKGVFYHHPFREEDPKTQNILASKNVGFHHQI